LPTQTKFRLSKQLCVVVINVHTNKERYKTSAMQNYQRASSH